jgi:hypothetical protein
MNVMKTDETWFPANLVNWGIPSGIAASFFYLALQPDLRTAVPLLVGITAVVTLLLALALHGAEKGSVGWSPGAILVVALLLRLPFLIRPAELSDDIYRYLWDGLQTLAGSNPYMLAPANVHPTAAAAEGVRRLVNHSEFVTIYPPTAQLLFAAGALLGKSVLGIKAFLTVLDLAACALIIRLMKALHLPPARAVLYAWHPLPVLEIAGSGHIDGAGFLFLLIALNLLASHIVRTEAADCIGTSPRPSAGGILVPLSAGFACAGAILVKLLPLIFLPGLLLLVRSRARKLFLAGILSGTALLTLPFLPDIRNGLATLGTYAHDWEFAGFAFRTVRRLTGSGQAARLLLASVFLCLMAGSYGRLWRGREKPAEGLERLRATLRAFYGIVLAFLLLTPTLHPWYALSLAFLLPFAAGPAGLVLCWSVFLAYRVLIPYTLLGLWIEDDRTAAITFLAPAIAFLIPLAVRLVTRRKPAPSLLP